MLKLGIGFEQSVSAFYTGVGSLRSKRARGQRNVDASSKSTPILSISTYLFEMIFVLFATTKTKQRHGTYYPFPFPIDSVLDLSLSFFQKKTQQNRFDLERRVFFSLGSSLWGAASGFLSHESRYILRTYVHLRYRRRVSTRRSSCVWNARNVYRIATSIDLFQFHSSIAFADTIETEDDGDSRHVGG